MLSNVETDALNRQIDSFLNYSWAQHRKHFWLNVFMVVSISTLGLSVTVAGIRNQADLAAIFGASISALLAIQNSLNFAGRANIWEIKHNDAKSIRDRLKYKVKTGEDFQLIVDSWLNLKTDLMVKMPRVNQVAPDSAE